MSRVSVKPDGSAGFPARARCTPVPDLFFARYLPRLQDPSELKTFLHVWWRIHRRARGTVPALRVTDLESDPTLARSLRGGAASAAEIPRPEGRRSSSEHSNDWPGIEGLGETGPSAVLAALDGLVAAGLLVEAMVGDGPDAEKWVFRNDPAGRRARDRAQAEGLPREAPSGEAPLTQMGETSIYALYEENIGPLTPLIAEELADAEALHSPQRIEAAFKAAVEANVRRWSYVKAVLERMSREKSNAASGQGGGGARERYLEGEYAGFVDG